MYSFHNCSWLEKKYEIEIYLLYKLKLKFIKLVFNGLSILTQKWKMITQYVRRKCNFSFFFCIVLYIKFFICSHFHRISHSHKKYLNENKHGENASKKENCHANIFKITSKAKCWHLFHLSLFFVCCCFKWFFCSLQQISNRRREFFVF